MSNYRAIRVSYGFRNQYWSIGDIAEGVTVDEKIHDCFELVNNGESLDKPLDESKKPPEPMTLSEMADQEQKAIKTGKEFMQGAHPKVKRK